MLWQSQSQKASNQTDSTATIATVNRYKLSHFSAASGLDSPVYALRIKHDVVCESDHHIKVQSRWFLFPIASPLAVTAMSFNAPQYTDPASWPQEYLHTFRE